MEAVREEVLGPVRTVQAFDDDAEGLALAAHPHYGLAAGVYTADISKALRETCWSTSPTDSRQSQRICPRKQIALGRAANRAFATDFGIGFGTHAGTPKHSIRVVFHPS